MKAVLGSIVAAPIFAAALTIPRPASAPLFGDWKTADGSVVRTFSCGQAALCIKILSIPATAPGKVDHNNPDAALRNRPLCNLQIGHDFNLKGETEASGGRLYDPESGRTYRGNIALDGDQLKLRGYIGFAAFGRTEIWHRAATVKPCG